MFLRYIASHFPHITRILNLTTFIIAHVFLYKPTVFSLQIMNDEINEGETKTICCYVVSNPAPSATRLLNRSQEIFVTYRTKQICYTIKHVSRYDQGNYTCLATNIIGKGSVTISLQVNCKSTHRICITNS